MKNKTEPNVTFLVIATGQYNSFLPSLASSALNYADFKHDFLIFSDQEHQCLKDMPNVSEIVPIPSLEWPRMPLLRFELYLQHLAKMTGEYIISLDAESRFDRVIKPEVFASDRVACLHRNITRLRKDFNYEDRTESTAYVGPDEGERYYACGLVGGTPSEFERMSRTLSENIRTDIANGIRARWGDESHLNRYYIDNEPTLILPPNYMCPAGNPYFRQYITHRDKAFKRVNIRDTDQYLTVNPADYEVDWCQ